MPPRYAYWTILIDNAPTAFRARERDELLPTFNQLKRKNTDAAMKWFARGTLWESPEAADAARRAPRPAPETRGVEWRPGGKHRDPRDRFKRGAKQAGGPAGQSARPRSTARPRPDGPPGPAARKRGQ
jgi:hypothetical protein